VRGSKVNQQNKSKFISGGINSMKRKFSKILGVGLTLALLTSMLVTATPVSAQTEGTIELGVAWYKTGDAVTVTVTDADLNVPAPVTGEIIGTGDATTKTFTVDVSRRPIIDVTGDGVVGPADVVVHDLQVGVVDVYAVDADTGGITLVHAPDQVHQNLMAATLPADDMGLTTPPDEATKLLLTVVPDGINAVAGDVYLTGTSIHPLTLVTTSADTETIVVGTDATTPVEYLTTKYWTSIDADGIDAVDILDGTPTLSIDETHTVAADYTGSGTDTINIEICSDTETTPEPVTLTETNPDTGVFTGSIATTAGAAAVDGQLSVAHGDTITATYEDANPAATLDDTASVDDVVPTISDLAPADAAYVDTNTPTISATLADALAGIDATSIVFKLENADPPTVPLLDSDYTYDAGTGVLSFTPDAGLTYETLADDIWYVIVNVDDLAGNPAIEEEWSFTVDTTDPAIQTTTLTAPNGAEVWAGDSSQDITWTSGHITDTNLEANPISLHYSTDSGVTYPFEIVTGLDNTGSYSWTVPIVDSETVSVQITATDLAGNTATDESNAVFTIDGTNPTLLGIAWTDVDDSGTVSGTDTLLFIFSEDMDTSTVTSANIDTRLPISGTGTTYSTTDLDVDWATPAGDDTLTVTLGDEVDAIVGDTVDPADAVTDPAGNPDATADPGAAILPPAPTEIAVTATPESILPDGIAKSTITATVTMYGKVVEGVDVSFSTTAGIIYPTAASTGDNGVATAELTASTVVETATVTASVGGVTPATVDVIFGPDEFTMPDLVVGWNLISLPLIPSSPSIGSVLDDLEITKTVEVVWSYDAVTCDWYYYQPSTGYGDLLQMVDGKGYWVQMVEPASGPTLSGMETPAPGKTPSQYAVVVGWNLIGFRSISTTTDANTYLASISFTNIYAHGASGHFPVAGAGVLVPGSGYWVYVMAPGYIAP